MNKRGQFFTIVAILLIALIFLSFEIFSIFREKQSVKTRVETMDSFLHSIEENLERQLFISGYRTIFEAQNYTATYISYISNVDAFFEEAFFNGTVNGAPSDIMLGVTYQDIIDSINSKASKINVNIIIENTTVDVSQDDPWHVKFTMVSDFIMRDNQNLALWQKKQIINAFVPIEEFEDPFFIVETNRLVSRKINRTIYEGNYVVGADYSNLRDHVDKKYYTNNSDAPSFLKRMTGDFSSDPNGIESFVNALELSSQGILPEDKSLVDHIYFSGSNPPWTTVPGMQAWFKIDDGHKSRYQIP